MAIKITSELDCTGCSACSSICPVNCINLEVDHKGFEYPIVDKSKCINCNLCVKVCPIINRIVPTKNINNANIYAGWTNDIEARYNSTSGGIFYELASSILSNGGYVVGAIYGKNMMVEHTIISKKENLNKVMQSKYSQSVMHSIFRDIKKMLEDDKHVLFCGTPCQVAGLKSYLLKDYSQLYTIDFICRGVNSPKAFQSWLKELEMKYQSKVIKVWFKYKKYGWKKSPLCTRLDFENGKQCVKKSYNNTYMRGYLGPNLYIRPSCSDCKFKGSDRISEITLADFWGIDKSLDDDKGTSLIIINNAKGKVLFDSCKDRIICYERDYEEMILGNECFRSSVKINPNSEKFLVGLENQSFNELINEFAKVSLLSRFSNKIKHRIQQIGRIIIK